MVWAHTAEDPHSAYQADEDSLTYCSRRCAQDDDERRQQAYLRRIEQGLRAHGAAQFLRLNPLLAEDITRVARRLGLTIPTAA